MRATGGTQQRRPEAAPVGGVFSMLGLVSAQVISIRAVIIHIWPFYILLMDLMINAAPRAQPTLDSPVCAVEVNGGLACDNSHRPLPPPANNALGKLQERHFVDKQQAPSTEQPSPTDARISAAKQERSKTPSTWQPPAGALGFRQHQADARRTSRSKQRRTDLPLPKQNPTRGLQKKELLPPQVRKQQNPAAPLPNQGYDSSAKQSPPAFALPALLGACSVCQQRLGAATSKGRSQPRRKGQQRSPQAAPAGAGKTPALFYPHLWPHDWAS